MLLVKGRGVGPDVVGLGQHLEARALQGVSAAGGRGGAGAGPTDLGADVVKVELVAGRALDVDAAGELHDAGLVGLAVLEVGEVAGKVADVVVDVELGRGR